MNTITKPKCRAKSKQSGVQCKRYPVPGREVCKIHGGASPIGGPTHPSYKTGKYSKHLPKKLLDSYEVAINDTNLLALRNEIALIDSRAIELLGKMDQGEAGDLWKKLKVKYKEYLKEEDGEKQATYIADIGSLIKRGYKDHMVWSEIYTVLDQRKKLVESERKSYVELGQILTMEQAAAMMAQVSKAINDTVTNVDDKRALATVLSGIMGKVSKPLLED